MDDYADSNKARLIDSNICWQEIPDDWIEEFYDVFAFMDAKGFRHAIPAYMTWCLKYNKRDSNSLGSMEYYLSPVENSDELYHKELFKLLDESQRQVISEFRQFLDSVVYSF